ncbi:Alpha-N-acetylgalactosaminidase [subsurface metagenome]
MVNKQMDRKDFLKSSAVAGVALTMAPYILTGQDDRKANIAFIGVGSKGTSNLRVCLARGDVEVTHICDIDKEAAARAEKLVTDAGQKKPRLYTRGAEDYLRMLEQGAGTIDGVIISTPWLWHTPMSVASMKAGMYAAPEVWGATTIDECWELVNTSEETGMPCMMLENHCYDRDSMTILRMVREGLFGELIHCQCGYQHDIRNGKTRLRTDGEVRWRIKHSITRNGDLYPTHGLGPIANCLDDNRGNRMVSLTSTATKSRGLHNYIVEHGDENHPLANTKFALGDIVTSVVKTAREETIVINHDTNLPRPYTDMYRVQGTKGLWMEDGYQIYIEGMSPKEHQWEPFEPYMEKYEHPLWQRHGGEGSHGGADPLKNGAFVECVKRKIPTPIDVYDTAAWIVVSPLSEQSIAQGNAPVEFPDFTKGKWKTNKPIFGLIGEY